MKKALEAKPKVLEPSPFAPLGLSIYQMCVNKHPLEKFTGKVPAYRGGCPQCDICGKSNLEKLEYFYRCNKDCSFDVCKECYLKHNPPDKGLFSYAEFLEAKTKN